LFVLCFHTLSHTVTHPKMITPNFISVRLLDDDKDNFALILAHEEKRTGITLSVSDLYRLAIKALAEKHNIKGVR